jgi:hypothetical protein
MWGPGPAGWCRLESERVTYGHESLGTQTQEWLRWCGPGAIVNDTPILSSERMLHKDYNRMCSVRKNTGRGFQGARR